MNTKTKRIIWDIWLVLITAMVTFIVTTSVSPGTPEASSSPARVLNTPSPEIIEKTVEVVVTKEVVVTATPEPATATPTPSPTPEATLGPVSVHATMICFPGDVSQNELEQILAGQAELPSGAREAQILDSGYVIIGYVPPGGYKFCAFSYELNRDAGEELVLAFYAYGANESFETYSMQVSSLEPQRVYALVSHSLIINPNGRWVGGVELINPNTGILLVDELSIAGNKVAGGGGGGGATPYPTP